MRADSKVRRARRKVRRGALAAAARVSRILRLETIGGLIMLAATALALIVANSPLGPLYQEIAGPVPWPPLRTWATDGFLTVFFVVAGLELKRELVVGELRDPRKALLPAFAAVGGMVVPAAVCLAVAAGAPGGARAWAVPVATDIAFALAVLALTASRLPSSVRVFLLTLAIVDDLGAITLIAVVYTEAIYVLPLICAVAVIAAYVLAQQRRIRAWWLYGLLALAAWFFTHEAGIHATVAGVAVGLATRVRRDKGEDESPAERLEHNLQPISAGVCVPLFAFFAAGVTINANALSAMVRDRVVWAVIAGLVLGKVIGVLGGAGLAVATKLARLPKDITWWDLAAVSVLTGCGFTVSILITELAFGGEAQLDSIKLAVLVGSLLAALLAAALLRLRVRAYLVR